MMRIRGLVLILVALLAACEREVKTQEGPVTRTPLVGTPAPRSGGSTDVAISSVLYSEHDAVIRARMDGVVTSVQAELSDQIQAGQLLATQEDDRENAVFESASAATELARARHERAAQLGEMNMIAQAELDDAVFELRSANAALERARVELEYTRVRAPFAGTIAKRYARVGQRVEEGDPLFRVTALRPLRAQVSVPELRARALVRGATVTIRGLDGERVEGRITRVGAAVDPTSGTVDVLVDVPAPGLLRPGSSIVVELPSVEEGDPGSEVEAATQASIEGSPDADASSPLEAGKAAEGGG